MQLFEQLEKEWAEFDTLSAACVKFMRMEAAALERKEVMV